MIREREKDLKIQDHIDGYLVSTVALGYDHSWGEGEPEWYETMIFNEGDWGERYIQRYATKVVAERNHSLIVEQVKQGMLPTERA